LEWVRARHPVGRLGEPDEAAQRRAVPRLGRLELHDRFGPADRRRLRRLVNAGRALQRSMLPAFCDLACRHAVQL
jgi:hypothetical protein